VIVVRKGKIVPVLFVCFFLTELLDRRLGGPQIRSGRDGEEKNTKPPPEFKP
jgi:hypothetical protein